MIKNLLNWFGPRAKDTIKSCPEIQGHLTIQTFDRRGKVVQESSGFNIWTLTGREYLSEVIALNAFSSNPTRQTFRDDRVAYIALGTGSQEEVAEVRKLTVPVGLGGTASGTFLSPIDTCLFPATASTTTKTSVQFIKEFSSSDYSPSSSIVLTEAGLFTDGNPNDNWSLGTLSTAFAQSSYFSPVAYKNFEPITKTSDYSMKIVWEVRFI
jgi:hypothetical protein